MYTHLEAAPVVFLYRDRSLTLAVSSSRDIEIDLGGSSFEETVRRIGDTFGQVVKIGLRSGELD